MEFIAGLLAVIYCLYDLRRDRKKPVRPWEITVHAAIERDAAGNITVIRARL
ncbi:MAG: hypothetical protein AB1427_00920 [Thermodesulfobacteriota bacterium]